MAFEGSGASFLRASLSQKILIVQEFRVLACLPKTVQAEVEVHLNHLFALIGKGDRKSLNHSFRKQILLWNPRAVRLLITREAQANKRNLSGDRVVTHK